MQDESQSILEWLGGITPSDYVWIAALIGGALMWGVWRYQKKDMHHTPQIDKSRKKIKLGLYASGVVGLGGGVGLTSLLYDRGMSGDNLIVISAIAGFISTWLFHRVANWQYDWFSKLAQNPIFAAEPLPRYALPPPRGYSGKTRAMSSLDRQIHQIMGKTTDPVPISYVQDWNNRRTQILTVQTKAYMEERPLTKDELEQIHLIFPEAPDLENIQKEVDDLGNQHTNLTLTEKMSYRNLLITYQEALDVAITELQDASRQLDDRDKRYRPEHRVPREIIYTGLGTIGGFLFRSFIGG